MWKTGSEIPVVSLGARTREWTRASVKQCQISGHERSLVIGGVWPVPGRSLSGDYSAARLWGPKSSLPSHFRSSISLLNVNAIILLGLRRP